MLKILTESPAYGKCSNNAASLILLRLISILAFNYVILAESLNLTDLHFLLCQKEITPTSQFC